MQWTKEDAAMADKFCAHIERATYTVTGKELLEFHRCLAWFNKILLDMEGQLTEKPPVTQTEVIDDSKQHKQQPNRRR